MSKTYKMAAIFTYTGRSWRIYLTNASYNKAKVKEGEKKGDRVEVDGEESRRGERIQRFRVSL